MGIIRKASTEHHCRIGWKTVTVTDAEANQRNITGAFPPAIAGTFLVEDLEINRLPTGSVVDCDTCGQVWVKAHTGWRYNANSAYWADDWRPETKRERRRRLRTTTTIHFYRNRDPRSSCSTRHLRGQSGHGIIPYADEPPNDGP